MVSHAYPPPVRPRPGSPRASRPPILADRTRHSRPVGTTVPVGALSTGDTGDAGDTAGAGRSGGTITLTRVQRAPTTHRTAISPLARSGPVAPRAPEPTGEHHLVEPSPTRTLRPTPATIERPGFDHGPFVDESPERVPGWRTRLVRATVLLAVTAATAALIVAIPTEDERASSSNRIETADRPLATAELLRADGESIDGSLGDIGELAGPGPVSYARTGPIWPLEGGYDFATLVEEEAEQEAEQEITTTTVWAEPTIPPESEWVDTGNGVLVPDLLLRIRFCESTNNYQAANRSSTARGAYQFLTKSWQWYGHAELTGATQAHLATPAQQDQAALRTLQSEGTGPWRASRSCWSGNLPAGYATARPQPAPAATSPTSTAVDPTADPATATTAATDGSTTTETGQTTATTATSSSVSTSSSTTTAPSPTTTLPPSSSSSSSTP